MVSWNVHANIPHFRPHIVSWDISSSSVATPQIINNETTNYCIHAPHRGGCLFFSCVINLLMTVRTYLTFNTGSSQRRPLFPRALSLYGIMKCTRKYTSPFLLKKIQISQYTIYLLNFVLGYLLFIYYLWFRCKRCAYFSFYFFAFSKIPMFHFYISKELTIWREISLYTLK